MQAKAHSNTGGRGAQGLERVGGWGSTVAQWVVASQGGWQGAHVSWGGGDVTFLMKSLLSSDR